MKQSTALKSRERTAQKPLLVLAIVALTTVLAFGLTACGGGKSGGASAGSSASASSASAPTKKLEPAANTNPIYLEAGSSTDHGKPSGESDMWYVDGDKSKGGLYFENFLPLAPVFVDADGKQLNEYGYPSAVEDNHLIPAEEGEGNFDLIFNDPMTCYDLVSGTWYIRGDYNKELAKIVDTHWTNEDNPEDSFTLKANGTIVWDNKEESTLKTWDVTAIDRVTLLFEDEESGFAYDCFYDDNGRMVRLEGFTGIYNRDDK